jgi:hypothetical protein
MKKNYIILGIALLAIGTLAFQHTGKADITKFVKFTHKNQNGAPAGRTGAPGEPSCATSTCHSGAAQDGSAENTFILLSGATVVTDYLPGQTYNVTVAMASNPAKKGFQATALDGSNNMAGTFTGQTIGGTAVNSSAGRQYANHTGSSNQSSENSVWIWTWTAPATDVGPVTFYVATNKTNNSNTAAGDVIYLSEHVIGSAASVNEEMKEESNFAAGYNSDDHKLVIDFQSLSSGEMYLNLVDLNGRSAFTTDLGKAIIGKNNTTVKLPVDLKNGIYFVNVFVHNKPMSAKIMIQR